MHRTENKKILTINQDGCKNFQGFFNMFAKHFFLGRDYDFSDKKIHLVWITWHLVKNIHGPDRVHMHASICDVSMDL